MKLNDKQSNMINDFMIRYNSNMEYKEQIQEAYDNDIHTLSMLEVYALEEVLLYGTKGLFKKFLASKENLTEEQAINTYDMFMNCFNTDATFASVKTQQLETAPETLSKIELFAFELIRSSMKKVEEVEEDVESIPDVEIYEECDPLNPILFDTDRHIKDTIENLLIGQFINTAILRPEYQEIGKRQQDPGVFLKDDKQKLIELVRDSLKKGNNGQMFKNTVDNKYAKIKMAILLGKGEDAFGEDVRFNTNISSSEVFGKEKEFDAYEFFREEINRRRNK